jgi:hypothetical protein
MLRYTSLLNFSSMKRSILIALLAILVGSFGCYAEGRCIPRWYIGQSIINGNDTRSSYSVNADTTLASGESIWITVSSQLLCTGDCSLQYPEAFTWIHNGDTVISTNYLVEDTGLYIGIIRYSSCVAGTYRLHLRIKQEAAAETEQKKNTESTIEIFPTVSSGMYTIRSTNELSKVQVRNSAGNLVFSTDHHISSVDITHLSEGLYFYYIEDESRNIKRGKLVKR